MKQMRVALSPVGFDLAGHVAWEVSRPDTDLGETRRRVNRVATLDGGAVVNDFGHSEADRTVTLEWDAGAVLVAGVHEAVDRLVRLYGRLRLVTQDGVFLVAPESYKRDARRARLVLLVLERLSSVDV